MAENLSQGQTPDGKLFQVPKTYDVLNNLFIPSKHTVFEQILGGIAIIQILLFFVPGMPREAFLFLFLFWRLGYNGFLGYLLHKQSNGKFVQRWCKRNGFFNEEASLRPKWVSFTINQLKLKMGPSFVYEVRRFDIFMHSCGGFLNCNWI